MTDRIAIFGYGSVGRATTARLLAEGRAVIVAQRRAPPDLPAGSDVRALRRARPRRGGQGRARRRAVRGRDRLRLFRRHLARGVAEGDRQFRRRMQSDRRAKAFIDNLYMYGPQTTPLVETMPVTDTGLKPAARAAATRIWMDAAAKGEALITALRAPDFYGPGVGNSYLGDTSIGKLAQGKQAVFVGSPDVLHDYAYVRDSARAVTTLLAAPDSAFGQTWHVPCAPTRAPRGTSSRSRRRRSG